MADATCCLPRRWTCVCYQFGWRLTNVLLLFVETETCPLYPARYIHQTLQLTAQESIRFVSVLVPHGADESGQSIASSLRAAYEPRGSTVSAGYTVRVSLQFRGADITATMHGVNPDDTHSTDWSVKRNTSS